MKRLAQTSDEYFSGLSPQVTQLDTHVFLFSLPGQMLPIFMTAWFTDHMMTATQKQYINRQS